MWNTFNLITINSFVLLFSQFCTRYYVNVFSNYFLKIFASFESEFQFSSRVYRMCPAKAPRWLLSAHTKISFLVITETHIV